MHYDARQYQQVLIHAPRTSSDPNATHIHIRRPRKHAHYKHTSNTNTTSNTSGSCPIHYVTSATQYRLLPGAEYTSTSAAAVATRYSKTNTCRCRRGRTRSDHDELGGVADGHSLPLHGVDAARSAVQHHIHEVVLEEVYLIHVQNASVRLGEQPRLEGFNSVPQRALDVDGSCSMNELWPSMVAPPIRFGSEQVATACFVSSFWLPLHA